jgi:hypothetical protein
MTATLRSTVNVVSVLAAGGLIGFLAHSSSEKAREQQTIDSLAADVDRFRQVLAYRAAANQTEVNPRGWPVTVDPEWFNGDPPRNTLVSPDRPWVEVAPPSQAALSDPPMRMTVDGRLAAFWYNPYQGVVRARVPVSINDAKAISLYNAINGTHLDSIYAPAPIESPAHAGAAGSTGAEGGTGSPDPVSEAATAIVTDPALDPELPGSSPASTPPPPKH